MFYIIQDYKESDGLYRQEVGQTHQLSTKNKKKWKKIVTNSK